MKQIIAIIILFAIVSSALAADARRPVKVFILAGQSNLEGQAVVDLEGKDYNGGKGTLSFLLGDPATAGPFRHLRDAKGQWTVRDDVWVRYKPENGALQAGALSVGFTVYGGRHHFGPELEFGHVVGDHVENRVLLVKTAWGGKSLYKDFRPPSSGGEVGPYYTKMVAQVREALANLKKDFPAYDGGGYELAGFVWYHGWNDGVDPKNAVPEYERNLVNLIKDVRKEFDAPRLPVVIGELTGPWKVAPPEWTKLRLAQRKAAERAEFKGSVLFVETHDFVRRPEDSPNPGHGHHEFGNAETYFLVGEALGKGMVKLLEEQAKEQPKAVQGRDGLHVGGLIGYTEFQSNLPGGRHANGRTMRAYVVNADGSGRRAIGAELADRPDSWTQFAGWSPDGRTAVVHRGWESPENARWEEEHKTFRFNAEGWLLDSYLVDMATGKAQNVTAVERVSFYNTAFFWPGDGTKLGMTALIDGNSHPFRMDRDGANKVDLTKGSKEFTYGFSASPDGRRIAYHKSYQVFLADADGSNARRVETGNAFNFAPAWSPDGKWVLFVSGEHYDCHPHIVRADGTGLRKIADRGGYRGVIEYLDVPDFHGGSSDTPAWAADGASVIYTAMVGKNVELFRVGLDGMAERVTTSAEGTLHYHPAPSRDGKWLMYGSKREGVRQLFVMSLASRVEKKITDLKAGQGAMWAYWQPAGESN
jgi:Tol biopolymer transport system component